MTERRAPDLPPQEKPAAASRPAAAVLANVAAAGGVLAVIVTFVAAGWRAFAISLIVVGILIGGGALVYQFGRTRWYAQRSKQLQKYALYALSGILLATGILLVFLVQSPAKTPCSTQARVSGADSSAKSFAITVTLTCAAPPENQLWLVEEVLNQGRPGTIKHSEYYLGWQISNVTNPRSVNDTPVACNTRRFYLISVSADQLALLESSSRTPGGAYYGEPIDTYISKYIVSNVQLNHTCNG
jgi:hypothetical protein